MSTPAPLRATEYFLQAYKRVWRASVMSTFLNPVLYLAALGIGLGTLVDRSAHSTASLGGVSYLQFVAPALLATTAMQNAANMSTYQIYGSIKWEKTYFAMLATPLSVGDVLAGQLIWIALRTALAVTVYLGVLTAFGAARSVEVLLALPAGLLTGMAFSCPMIAYSASRETESSFPIIFRFLIVPMFLFSGTFFPVTQLPAALRYLAYVTPLYRGVDLARSLALGTASLAPSVIDVVYLSALTVAGIVLARAVFNKRLRT